MKKTHIENKLNININKDDSSINDFLFCWNLFDQRPNRLTIYNSYSTNEFSDIVDSIAKSKNIHTEIISSSIESIVNDQIFIKVTDGIFLSYIILDRNNQNSTINELIFYYKSQEDYDRVLEIIQEVDKCVVSYELQNSSKLNTLSLSQNTLDLEPIIHESIDLDSTELYYSEKTFTKIEKLSKSIKKSKKGLSILYGKRGSGKTSIINYLSSKLDRIVIFVPNNLIEQTINNAEFRRFLKKHDRPILVIDDCEMLFNEVFAKSNIFVNNLMQMVDGFLQDNLMVNVITIFNVDDEDEIDHSLLDCNNLIDIIEFQFLSSQESTELSNHLGLSKKYKSKNKLIDIIKKRETKSSKEIGF